MHPFWSSLIFKRLIMPSNVLLPRTGEIDPDARDLAWLNRQLGVGDRLVVSARSLEVVGRTTLEEEKIEMLADVLRSVDVERLIGEGVTRIDICNRGETDLSTTLDGGGILYINVYSGQSRSDTIRDICEKVNIDPPEGYTDEDATRITTGYLSLPPQRVVRRRMKFLLAAAAGLAIGVTAVAGVVGWNKNRVSTQHEVDTAQRIPPLPPVTPLPNAAGKTPPPPPRIIATPDPDPMVIRETCRVRFEDTGVLDTEGMPVGHYGSCDTTVADKVTPVMQWAGRPRSRTTMNFTADTPPGTTYKRPAEIFFHLENPPRDCMAGPIEVAVGKTRDYPDTKITCVGSLR